MLGVETCEEEPAQVDSPRARDGLEGTDALLSNRWAVGADEQLLRGGGQFGQTFDSEVFVQGWVLVDDFTGLSP